MFVCRLRRSSTLICEYQSIEFEKCFKFTVYYHNTHGILIDTELRKKKIVFRNGEHYKRPIIAIVFTNENRIT